MNTNTATLMKESSALGALTLKKFIIGTAACVKLHFFIHKSTSAEYDTNYTLHFHSI